MEGNSVVTMKQGSNIGTSPGRRGKVLRITGTNAGATIGYFYNHNIKCVLKFISWPLLLG